MKIDTYNKSFYELSKPEFKERTAERLIEIIDLGMVEVGFGQFGIPEIMSGLYIEKVWSYSNEDWTNYIDWVEKLIMERILIIDIETTGFLQKGGKIVEVGVVSLNLHNGRTEVLFDKVVKPKGITKEEIENSWIVQNSDLTVESVISAPDMEDELPKIQSIIDVYKAGSTAYNNRFDFDFLESVGIKFNKKLPCPMLLSTDICKLPGKYSSYKWPKVEEAWKHFFPKKEYVEKHRGADDAQHEALIVFELYKMGVFKLEAKAVSN